MTTGIRRGALDGLHIATWQRSLYHALAILMALAPLSAKAATTDNSLPPATLEAIQNRLDALTEVVGESSREHCLIILGQARQAMTADLHVAAALLNVVLRVCPEIGARPDVLLDAARAEASLGATREAIQHFMTAANTATASHEITAAVEGFVANAPELEKLQMLPPVARYIETLGDNGLLDDAAYETLYTLARSLTLQDDPRAADLLVTIPPEARAARRALYVLGTLYLRQGQIERAREEFLKAAALPLPPIEDPEAAARESRVLELTWLAVGRLAFEVGDQETGYYAYHQVLVGSPSFAQAFLELGWLAIEAGDQDLAMLAFEPLVTLDAHGETGRRAALAEGYVLLHKGQYAAAESHYTAIAKRYTTTLASFNRAVSDIHDLADLARDCETRNHALKNVHLSPVMGGMEIKGARSLDRTLDHLVKVLTAARKQADVVEGMLAGSGRFNPLQSLQHAKTHGLETLRQINNLNSKMGSVRERKRWRAALEEQKDPQDCCNEPSDRIRMLREHVEGLLLHIDNQQEKISDTFRTLENRWREAALAKEHAYEEEKGRVRQKQRLVVEQAVAAARDDLYNMIIEGDAGVLEAIWRFKEDHREQIKQLEIERKNRLQSYEQRYEQRFYEANIEIEDS